MRHKTGGDGAATATRRGYRIESGKSRTGLHTVGPQSESGKTKCGVRHDEVVVLALPPFQPRLGPCRGVSCGRPWRGGVDERRNDVGGGWLREPAPSRAACGCRRACPPHQRAPTRDAPTSGHGVGGYFRIKASSHLNLQADRRLSPGSIRSTFSPYIHIRSNAAVCSI